MVPGGASPDDPALTDYWAKRRRKHRPPLGEHTVRLLHRQQARCPLCGDYLLHVDHEPTSPQEWEQWSVKGHPWCSSSTRLWRT